MIGPNWDTLDAPLRRVASVLKITPEAMAANEAPDKLAYRREDLPAADAQQVTLDEWLALQSTYGDALKLELRVGGRPVLSLSAPVTTAVLAKFASDVRSVQTLVLDMELDKQRLLARCGVAPGPDACKLYFSSAALVTELRASPVELEAGLFRQARGDTKILILVLDYGGALDGMHLAILGRPALAAWSSYLPTARPDPAPVTLMNVQARRVFSWSHFELEFLTPLQLMVAAPGGMPGPQDAVANALAEKLVALSIIYTADRTRAPLSAPGGVYESHYADGTARAQVSFGIPDELAQALGAELIPLNTATGLAARAQWAYLGERDQQLAGSDRLYVLQGVVARMLQDADPAVNYKLLVRRADRLGRDVEQAWQSYTQDKLEVYFSRVKQVEEAVEALVKKTTEEIQGLIKSLTESMLAAVGVVVGSFIGAVFGSGFNATVFRLGLVLYAVYLLVFPGIIGLIAARQRYLDARAAFDKRRTEFESMIPKEKVNELVGSVVDKQGAEFYKWLYLSTAIFAIVFGLLLVGAVVVPGWITVPAATPTPTPTP